MRLLLCLLAICFLGIGCQSAYYHPFDGSSGYSDSPIKPDVYEVSYAGSSRASSSDARYYATVRAAEIGLTLKKSWMEILQEDKIVQSQTHYIPGYSNWVYAGPGYRRHYYYVYETPGYYERSWLPTSTIQVKFSDEKSDKTLNIRDMLIQANDRGVMLNDSTKRELGLDKK